MPAGEHWSEPCESQVHAAVPKDPHSEQKRDVPVSMPPPRPPKGRVVRPARELRVSRRGPANSGSQQTQRPIASAGHIHGAVGPVLVVYTHRSTYLLLSSAHAFDPNFETHTLERTLSVALTSED